MVTGSLPVTVEAIIPSAVYRDTVYTQDAVVSVADSSEFRVYDHSRALSEDDVGTTQSVAIRVFLAKVQPCTVEEQAIRFDDESQPVFRGRVTDIDPSVERPWGVLDVGAGTVLFDPDEAEETVGVGDWLQLTRTVRHLQQHH